MRDAALAGLGMTLLPTFMIQAELTSGALLVIDPRAKPEGVEVIMAYPAQLGASAKLRALFAWLRRAFGDPPYWEGGLPGAAQDDGREA
jgi:DNA-binding transcriptional LysR family regulator